MADMNPLKSDQIRLIITVDPDTGQMWVTGPTSNKMLCAHMIADALKFIMDQNMVPKPGVPTLVVPNGNGRGN